VIKGPAYFHIRRRYLMILKPKKACDQLQIAKARIIKKQRHFWPCFFKCFQITLLFLVLAFYRARFCVLYPTCVRECENNKRIGVCLHPDVFPRYQAIWEGPR
jgi:hypothetical protein